MMHEALDKFYKSNYDKTPSIENFHVANQLFDFKILDNFFYIKGKKYRKFINFS